MWARGARSVAAFAAGVGIAVLGLTIAGSAGWSVPIASGEPDGTSPSVPADSSSPTIEVTVPDSSASTSTDSGVSSSADFGTSSSTPDGSTPDGSTPDGSTPDSSVPDSSAPDSSAPDTTGSAEASDALNPSPAPATLPTPGEVPALGDVTAVNGSPMIGGPAPDTGPACQPFWPCWFPAQPTEFVGPALCVTSPPPPDATPPPPFEFLGEMVAPAFDQDHQQWGFWRFGSWVPLYAYEC
jgi:hypothetical protein